MGILGLSKLLLQKCPTAVKEDEMKNYFGRRIAIDASMSIYQFIIAMKGFQDGQGVELTNEAGEVTSHLNGLFGRTLRMIDEGLKPIYVFDGAPPELKKAELEERRAKAAEAEAEFQRAKDAGDDEAMERLSKRTVRVTKEQTSDCKRLLRLMGLPIVEARGEAEAQCAELVRCGKAWAVATEDMDALTFGSKILLRHLTFSEAKKRPVNEYHLEQILAQTGFTMDMFIDLCILLGCDYTTKIPGIGPQKAYEGIEKYKSIEKFIENIDTTKHPIPEDFNYAEARKLFQKPDVEPCDNVKLDFKEPDEEGLIAFLCEEKLFNRERVEKGIARLKAALQKKSQTRLDQWFKPIPKPVGERPPAQTGQKRANPSAGTSDLPAGKMKKTGANNGAKKAVKK